MDVKYIPEDWEKTKEGIGELVGSGWSRGAIDNLKKLDTIIEKATGSIMRHDEDRVVHLPYKSQKGKYQELQKDYDVLHDFSGKVGGLIDTEIDQPFYEDMDAFAEAMRDLTIDKYETGNTVGAKETIVTGSYGQTSEHIKDKIKVSDIFSSNNLFMASLKAEFDAYKKENPESNMSYETYQKRRLDSRAFNYDSIKDQQEHKEFWRDAGILGTTLLLAGATVFFPPAGAALFAFTATVGTLEVSSAVTGKDWLTQRKLDTNERWLRGVLGVVDVAPVAKGLHAFGNVTTSLKSGVNTTTIKNASKVGLEEGGFRLKQADSLLTERAQNATNLVGNKIESLSLNIARKVDTTYTNAKIVKENLSPRLQPAGAYDVPVENNQWLEKKTVQFFDGLNLKSGSKEVTKGTGKSNLTNDIYKVTSKDVQQAIKGYEQTGKFTAQFKGFEVKAQRSLSNMSDKQLIYSFKKGYAPKDGVYDTIILHHHEQRVEGPIIEMPSRYHDLGNKRQHPFGNKGGVGSGEARQEFNKWRKEYWKARYANEMIKRGIIE